MTRKTLIIFAPLILALGAQTVLADDTRCVGIATTSFSDGRDTHQVKIESSTMVAANATVPEHCDVRGTIWPEVGFAVKLPTNWNNRFYMVGGGGFAGVISHPQMIPGLQKGYATASTDTGHTSTKEPLATFAFPGPNNPNADQKVVDYAYRAVHETAFVAKRIIKAYYGSLPTYSYWVGCSTGGRQGLMEAQRYPDDFDGLVVGAPVLQISGEQPRGIWNALAVAIGDGKIVVEKLPLLANAVYEKCDGIDGIKDGLIEDPRHCSFDPAADLPKCSGDADGPGCFTTAQIQGLRKVYGGVTNSAGKLLYPGQPPGAEIAASAPTGAPRSGWMGSIGAEPGAGLAFGETFMRYMAFKPPLGPTWDYRTINFDTDPPKMSAIAATIDATNPDLRPLKKRGGKIIHYHGWADALVNPQVSVNYYESVLRKLGEKETKGFYKLYMIPGMFHCAGGVGCNTFDWFTPLVAWVEKGVAPGTLSASRVEKGQAVRTRPICAYPETARYMGKGDINKAESFTCAKSSPKR